MLLSKLGLLKVKGGVINNYTQTTGVRQYGEGQTRTCDFCFS